jgi:hypothetical protein
MDRYPTTVDVSGTILVDTARERIIEGEPAPGVRR